jgi:type I restriction enzyme S subunit
MNAVTWIRKPLSEVADLCLGKMLDQNKNRGEPFPYLANVNVRWGAFELNDLRVMRFEPKEKDRYGLKFGDIVMCEGGEPGRCAIWKDQIPGMMIQKAIHRIRPKEHLDYRFFFYRLLHLGHTKAFDQYFTGATIKHLPGEKLAKVEIEFPPLAIQQRIAGILSAYDELIENSQRRIKILEAMARGLYREWFVHFRFPGHENHPLVASTLGEIPRGWEVRLVKDVAAVTYGFPFQSKKFNTNQVGLPVIRIRDILDASTTTFTDEVAAAKYHIKNGDILVGMDGDFHMCIWSSGHALQNQRVAKFESNSAIGNHHLFLALELPIQTWNKSIVGTTVAHLGDMHIKAIQIIWPTEKILDKASRILEPMAEQIITLKRQIQNLRRTRDLLLPRLLSGQIDIGEI